jgi:hypothetical protein
MKSPMTECEIGFEANVLTWLHLNC